MKRKNTRLPKERNDDQKEKTQKTWGSDQKKEDKQ